MERKVTTLCMLMAMLIIVIAIPVSSYSQTQTIASNPDNSSVNVESDTAGIKKARDLRQSGEYEQAKELLEAIISTSENPNILAQAYEGLGIVFIRKGELQEAELALKQALQSSQASEKLQTEIIANLAYVLDGQGRHKEAEGLHRQSLSILEQELTKSGQNSTMLNIGAVRNNLGLNMNNQGRYFEAIKHFEHTIEIYEKKGEVESAHYFSAFYNQALSYINIYNYNAANVSLEKARRVFESSSKNPLHTAVIYGLLGYMALENKDFKKANNYSHKSLEILEDLFDKTHWRIADAYLSLSRGDEVMDPIKAEEYLQEAIAIYQEAYDGKSHERLIKGYRQYGQFLHRQGDYKKAEIKYTKANQIAQDALASSYKKDLRVAGLKSDIGENYCAQKKSSLGLSVMQEALDIIKANLERDSKANHLLRTRYADQKSSIADCENQNQQKNIALDSFREASKIYQEVLSFYNLEGPDYLVQRLTEFREHFIQHILAIEQLERNQNRENFNETLALSQISQASRVSLAIRRKEAREQTGSATENIRKYQYYTNERQQLEEQLKEHDDNREIEKSLQDKIENITLTANYYKNEIPNYFEYLVPKALRLAEIQNRLEPKQAIINFIVTDSKVLSWGITQDDYHFHSFQMDRMRLANKIDKLRLALQKPDQIENFPFEITNELYEKLLEPFLKNFPEIDNLLIVPDGPLHSLPFGILTSEHDDLDLKNNTPPWLIKSYVIGILPSLETFVFSKKPKRFGERKLKIIGFGDPLIGNNQPRDMQELFSQRGVFSYSDIQQLPRLPETADELELIAKRFTLGISEMYLGNEATEKTLREANLSEANILIFATHAISASLNSELNEPAIVLTPVSELDLSNDGLLTSSEINNLKLNADLVILSACSTANTDLNANHAYTGLAQSFFFAGADSVLATHWDVETNAAAEITTGLISNLGGSNQLDFIKAFRLSILDVLDSEYSHPFYWAPFLIIGNN